MTRPTGESEGPEARPVDMPRVVTRRPVPMPMVPPKSPPVRMPAVRPGADRPATDEESGTGQVRPAPRPSLETVSDEQIRDWIDLAVSAVLEAGPIALEHFRTGMTVYDKRSHDAFDPVTVADRDVEASIREFLGRHVPGHRVIGEEQPDTPGDERFTWVIDPIDGTRAFISGLPLWGTLLGLVVDGVPVGGVMHQPFTGETFVADPVRGAVLVHGGTTRPLRTRPVPGGLAEAVLYSTSRVSSRWSAPPGLFERSPIGSGCSDGEATATPSRCWLLAASTWSLRAT